MKMTQVMQLSPPTQSKGKPERLFGGVYNWGCNTIPHVVLFYHLRLLSPYSLYHILISATTLL